MQIRLIFSLAFIASVAVPISQANAAGPATVRPGDPAINASVLRPYRNRWDMTIIKPDGQRRVVATTSDELVELESDGRRLFKRTQITTYKSGTPRITDVNVFDAATLEPVSMDWRMEKESDSILHHREFRDRVLTDETTASSPAGSIAKTKTRLSERVFDFYGGMYALIPVVLPLKRGYEVWLPAIAENSADQKDVRLRVTGREPVDATSGKLAQAWVIEAETYQGPMTFWVVQTPPYVIKLKWVAPQATVLYTMV